jgi:hypothetical protein
MNKKNKNVGIETGGVEVTVISAPPLALPLDAIENIRALESARKSAATLVAKARAKVREQLADLLKVDVTEVDLAFWPQESFGKKEGGSSIADAALIAMGLK